MVEGDGCHRIAAQHRKQLVGRKLAARSPNGRFRAGAQAIVKCGGVLLKIEVHGKNMFYFFGAEGKAPSVVVHVHFGLAGAFAVYKEEPEVGSSIRLRLETADSKAPHLVAHLSAMVVKHGCPAMDQSVCAGVGNIYRTEILYEAAIHPNQPANTLTRAEVLKLWNTAVKQMQAGYKSGSIWGTKAGSFCYDKKKSACGGKVKHWKMGGRSVYSCQKRQRLEARKAPKESKAPSLRRSGTLHVDGVDGQAELDFHQASHEAVDYVVRFCYGEVKQDSFQPSTSKVNEEILKISSECGLPTLTELCAVRLSSEATTANVVQSVRLCEEFGLSKLREALVKGIAGRRGKRPRDAVSSAADARAFGFYCIKGLTFDIRARDCKKVEIEDRKIHRLLAHFSLELLVPVGIMSSFSGILGASNQYGRWVPEQEITVKAIAGGSTVDFSQALFTQSAYTVYTKAFWGGVTIIVPPGVAVEQNGQAIMGAFAGNGGLYTSATDTVQSRATNASITIKVEGTAMWGSVTVAVNERAKPAVVLTQGPRHQFGVC
eukprot:s2623_g6.t1